jgi:hypothetical protein
MIPDRTPPSSSIHQNPLNAVQEGPAIAEPLWGFEWNQLEDGPRQWEEALFTIAASTEAGELRVMGTGFVVLAGPAYCFVISAAHVFEEVQRLQRGPSRSHRSTLPEFAPAPKPIDLSLQKVVTITRKEDGRAVFCALAGVAFDSNGDFGIAEIRPQVGQESEFPLREILLDDRVPQIGELVCIASYADLSCTTDDSEKFVVTRTPIVRVGKVLDVFPEGHRLCRGPCFETSIPVYSGMSGSPVFWYSPGAPLAAVGLVCSDPDEDGPHKNDRSRAGRSLVACLPVQRVSGSLEGKQELQISFTPTAGSGSFSGLSRS